MSNLRTAATVIAIGVSATTAHAQSAPGFYIDGYVQGSTASGDDAGQIGYATLDFGIKPGDFSGRFGVDFGILSYGAEFFDQHRWFMAATAQFGDTKLSLGRPRHAGHVIQSLNPFEYSVAGPQIGFLTLGTGTYLAATRDIQYGALVEHSFGASRVALSYGVYDGDTTLVSLAAEHNIANAFSFDNLRIYGGYDRRTRNNISNTSLSLGAELTNDRHRIALDISRDEDGLLSTVTLYKALYAYNFTPNITGQVSIQTEGGEGFYSASAEYRFLENGFARASVYRQIANPYQVNDFTIGYRF